MATHVHPDGDPVLVLQGGGALGSYQAGVYEAMVDASIEPTWVAGISIGAINSALIAGNAPERRIERLREFWSLVSSGLPATPSHAAAWQLPFSLFGQASRVHVNSASAAQVMLMGVPGFFTPRVPAAPLHRKGSLEAISYYDTTPLKHTLERLVDFDRINHRSVRLAVGAVNVRDGNLVFFDSARTRIDVRHVMASGALPPAFAPVEIDGEHYWDGGLVSNTPLNYVLEQPGGHRRTVFQVDLFPARGGLPQTMNEVGEREKDVRFSSRTRWNTEQGAERQVLAQAAQRLIRKLPPKLRDDPDARTLAELQSECPGVDIVHLIYRTRPYESHHKDYEFSRQTMTEHWASGQADMSRSLNDPRWLERGLPDGGVRLFDLARPARRAHTKE